MDRWTTTVWATWLVLGAVAAAGLADDADDRPPATGSMYRQYEEALSELLGNETEPTGVGARVGAGGSARPTAADTIESLQKRGYPPAQFILGVMKTTGFSGHPVDIPGGLTLLTASAFGGYQPAQLAVGHRHSTGLGFTKSCEAALPFFQAAAESWEAGYTFSKQRHFELQYLPARPSQKPRQMELNLIETMAAAGNLDAMHMLGESLYKGTNGFKQSSKMAYRYFIRSKTVPKSALRLGLMHLHGNGAEQNDNTAKLYFEAAVKKESRRGDALLATMYMDGRGTATDYTKALFFANRSAHSGDTIGVVTLGTMYFKGLGVRADQQRALKLFRAAAENGSLLARYNLGLMFAYGTGTHRACAEAVEMFRTVAMHGTLVLGLADAVTAYLDGKTETALRQFIVFSEMGYSTAMHNAAFIMHHESAPNASASAGDGAGGLAFTQKAVRLYKAAANLGVTSSKLQLGDIYFAQSNYTAAWGYYEDASTRKSALALFNMGWMYQQGLGVPEDFELARDAYNRASKADPDAETPVQLAILWLAVKERSLLWLGSDPTAHAIQLGKGLLERGPRLDIEYVENIFEPSDLLFALGVALVIARFGMYWAAIG